MSTAAAVSVTAGAAIAIAWMLAAFFAWRDAAAEGVVSPAGSGGRVHVEFFSDPMSAECQAFDAVVWTPAVIEAEALGLPADMRRSDPPATAFGTGVTAGVGWPVQGGPLGDACAARAGPRVVAYGLDGEALVYTGPGDPRELLRWVAGMA